MLKTKLRVYIYLSLLVITLFLAIFLPIYFEYLRSEFISVKQNEIVELFKNNANY